MVMMFKFVFLKFVGKCVVEVCGCDVGGGGGGVFVKWFWDNKVEFDGVEVV